MERSETTKNEKLSDKGKEMWKKEEDILEPPGTTRNGKLSETGKTDVKKGREAD